MQGSRCSETTLGCAFVSSIPRPIFGVHLAVRMDMIISREPHVLSAKEKEINMSAFVFKVSKTWVFLCRACYRRYRWKEGMTTRHCDVTWKRKDKSFVKNVFPVLSRRFSPQISLFCGCRLHWWTPAMTRCPFSFRRNPALTNFATFERRSVSA